MIRQETRSLPGVYQVTLQCTRSRGTLFQNAHQLNQTQWCHISFQIIDTSTFSTAYSGKQTGIKLRITSYLWVKFTDDGWISLTNGQQFGKRFHITKLWLVTHTSNVRQFGGLSHNLKISIYLIINNTLTFVSFALWPSLIHKGNEHMVAVSLLCPVDFYISAVLR